MRALLLLLFLPVLCFGQTNIAAPYCKAPQQWADGGAIRNVSIGTLNNTTNGQAHFYTYFNNLTPPILYRDSTYMLSITFDTIWATGNEHDQSWYYVLISFDSSNLQFSPVIHGLNISGQVQDSAVFHPASDTPITKTFSITIPHDAQLGLQRMRIIRYGLYVGTSTPYRCWETSNEGDHGETEDYDLDIHDIPPPDTSTFLHQVSNPHLAIYPNPAKDRIHIKGPVNDNIAIYNTLGRLCYLGMGREIDLSAFPSGIYYIRLNGAVSILVKQ